MEQALRNLYKSCFVLMQVSSLNYVGLRKLIKKATKQLGKDACEKAGFVTRDELRFAPFFLERNSESSSLAHQFSSVVEAIEACYASHFADGDKERAKAVLRSLRHPPPKGPEVLLMGTLLGATAVLAAWAAWLLRLPDTPSKCPFCTQYLLDTLPAFRVLLVPVVWLWTWAISCRVWESCAINYIYILDCNQHSSIGSSTAMRLAGNASVFLLAAFVAYVGALRTGVYWLVSPLHYPLFLLFFGAFTLFGPPIGTGFSSSRLYFLRCLWRSALAPCFEVRFRDNFVADVMTSMVVILRDIAAMVFFYLDGGGDDMPGRNRSSTTAIARLVTGPLITALPYWWRLMQCLRRWCVGWPGPDSPSTLPPVCLSSIAMLGRDGGEVKGEGERGILTQRAWSRTKGMSRVLSPAPPAPSEEQGTAQADSPLRLSFRAPPNQLHFLGSAICLPESLPPDESLDGAPNPLGA